ncbi:MAG: Crp/Fnr family transcriptional regulator [Velocimicrobium sp.]
MNEEAWKNALKDEKNQELFAHMPAKVFDCARVRKLKSGSFVVEKEQEIKEILLCCKGQMQVQNEFLNGTIYNFDYAEPISYIGVMELLADSTIYSAYLKAKTDCEILVIPTKVFFDWFYKDQWLILEVLKFVSKSMFERSFTIGEHRVYPAIFQIVKYLIACYEASDDDMVFIQKSKEEISTLFCISTRTVHRVLKQLKEANIVSVRRNGIGISREQYNKLIDQFEEMRNQV